MFVRNQREFKGGIGSNDNLIQKDTLFLYDGLIVGRTHLFVDFKLSEDSWQHDEVEAIVSDGALFLKPILLDLGIDKNRKF